MLNQFESVEEYYKLYPLKKDIIDQARKEICMEHIYRSSNQEAYTPLKEKFKSKLATKNALGYGVFISIAVSVSISLFLNYSSDTMSAIKYNNLKSRIDELNKTVIVRNVVQERIEKVIVKEEKQELCRDYVTSISNIVDKYKCDNPDQTLRIEVHQLAFGVDRVAICSCPRNQ
jgi:hypothetical protein